MATMNLRFAFEKETKGAVRFQEVGEDNKPAFAPSIGTLYIRKSALARWEDTSDADRYHYDLTTRPLLQQRCARNCNRLYRSAPLPGNVRYS